MTGSNALSAPRIEVMANENWHLSKSVPISFIVAIIGQTIALVWFFASLSSSVESNAKDIIKHDTRIESLENSVQGQAVMLARIDENLKAIRALIEQASEQAK